MFSLKIQNGPLHDNLRFSVSGTYTMLTGKCLLTLWRTLVPDKAMSKKFITEGKVWVMQLMW